MITVGLFVLFWQVLVASTLFPAGLGCLPSGSLGDGVDLATGIYHSSSRLQQHLMEGSLPEELLQLLVTHFLQGLHAAVVQRIGTSAMMISRMTVQLCTLFPLQGGHKVYR